MTVGTTKFDALIEGVDDLALADELVTQGFKTLTIQKGTGSYVPCCIVNRGESKAKLPNGLSVEIFDFAPSLASYMNEADLIISHAGSGSLFEALRLHKAVIAVPNPILMDNHQAELADHLQRMGHCASATPETLVEVVQGFDPSKLKPYQPGNPRDIMRAIERMMGFED